MKNSQGLLYCDSVLKAVVNSTLRLTGTAFSVEKRWSQEEMSGAFKRLCQFLKTAVEWEIEKGDFDVSVFSLFYPFFKYTINQPTADQACLQNITQLFNLVSTYRNKLQQRVIQFLASASDNGLKEITNKSELNLNEVRTRSLTNNFLSSEYFQLSVDLLEIANDQGLNSNVQNEAVEACRGLFRFSTCLIFQVPNCSEWVYDNLGLFTKNYLLEVRELVKALASECFAVREMALACLDELVSAREIMPGITIINNGKTI